MAVYVHVIEWEDGEEVWSQDYSGPVNYGSRWEKLEWKDREEAENWARAVRGDGVTAEVRDAD